MNQELILLNFMSDLDTTEDFIGIYSSQDKVDEKIDELTYRIMIRDDDTGYYYQDDYYLMGRFFTSKVVVDK